MSGEYDTFLTKCVVCRSQTTKRYARAHDGKCKSCVCPSNRALSWSQSAVFERRSADGRHDVDRVLEIGYEAYALENGYYE
jgi:hypothetical protein